MPSRDLDVTTFKEHFDRGQFTYGDTLPSVRDKDIISAVSEMQLVIKPSIYPDEASATLAKLYLTAHFLISDLGAAKSGGEPLYHQTSRTVGKISESVSLPNDQSKGPYSLFSTTYYGQKWLALTQPYLGVYIGCVKGRTSP